MLLKTKREIEIMREGGRRLRQVLEKVIAEVKPGVSKIELDKTAEREIRRQGGKPSFKMVPGYHSATCLTVNDEVVHGIPDEHRLEVGDIIGIDIGIYYQGFHTDLATTVGVGRISPERKKFLAAGRRTLRRAIGEAKAGRHLGNISRMIEEETKKAGFAPVAALTGHGVGRNLHEDPNIPCVAVKKNTQTPPLMAGMTLAIEVIYNQGRPDLVLEEDGWTIMTEDGTISGLFEETVAITQNGPLVLTA